MIPRKKVCSTCGRKLWKRDFYKDRGACKECILKLRAESYRNNKKIPEYIRPNNRGQIVKHKDTSVKIYWGEQRIADFKRMYPYNKNEELSIEFGCSVRTICRRAKELGLQKDEHWMRRIVSENSKIGGLTTKIRYGKKGRREVLV